MNTSLEAKKRLWPEFVKACESQWLCGGERYALSEGKEFTDLICEVVENKFCAGQILKQTGELININPKTEVGFFKIAVWAFIWWLKEHENLTERDTGEEFNTKGQLASTEWHCDRHKTTGSNGSCPICWRQRAQQA